MLKHKTERANWGVMYLQLSLLRLGLHWLSVYEMEKKLQNKLKSVSCKHFNDSSSQLSIVTHISFSWMCLTMEQMVSLFLRFLKKNNFHQGKQVHVTINKIARTCDETCSSHWHFGLLLLRTILRFMSISGIVVQLTVKRIWQGILKTDCRIYLGEFTVMRSLNGCSE